MANRGFKGEASQQYLRHHWPWTSPSEAHVALKGPGGSSWAAKGSPKNRGGFGPLA